MAPETVSAAAASVALIISIGAVWYAASVSRRLQRQDHTHEQALLSQQQDHERKISALETRVQERIADLTNEMVTIERSRRSDELAKEEGARVARLKANILVRLERHPVDQRATLMTVVNKGPATAKDVQVTVRARVEPPPGNPTGQVPRLHHPDELGPGKHLPPGSSRRLPIEMFDVQGAIVEWSWEDERPGRQTERQELTIMEWPP